MIIRKALVSLAAAGAVFGSTAAVAAPAVDSARTGSPVADAEGIGPFAIIVALLIVGGTIGVVASDSDEDPVSP